MINWIVIVVLVVIALFLLKMNRLRHKFWIILIVLLALFFYVTITLVHTANKFDLSNTEGMFSAGKVYLGWLGNGFQNLKVLTGKAIGMDWASTNGSFLNKTKSEKNKTISK